MSFSDDFKTEALPALRQYCRGLALLIDARLETFASAHDAAMRYAVGRGADNLSQRHFEALDQWVISQISRQVREADPLLGAAILAALILFEVRCARG
jgi:hypothetical protein